MKSLLDVQATLARLETLSVGVVGYRSEKFAGFYIRDSGYPVPWIAQSASEVADTITARDASGLQQALVVSNPIPDGKEMTRATRRRHPCRCPEGIAGRTDHRQGCPAVPPRLLP